MMIDKARSLSIDETLTAFFGFGGSAEAVGAIGVNAKDVKGSGTMTIMVFMTIDKVRYPMISKKVKPGEAVIIELDHVYSKMGATVIQFGDLEGLPDLAIYCNTACAFV